MERTEEMTGTENDPMVIAQAVRRFVCPSQCSGQGRCENGACQCNAGTNAKKCLFAILTKSREHTLSHVTRAQSESRSIH